MFLDYVFNDGSLIELKQDECWLMLIVLKKHVEWLNGHK